MVYPPLLLLMRTPWLPVVNWTDTPANLNGLIHFTKRRNLVSVCVPSHFKHSLQIDFCTIFHIFISPVVWETSSFVIILHVFLASQTRWTFNCINILYVSYQLLLHVKRCQTLHDTWCWCVAPTMYRPFSIGMKTCLNKQCHWFATAAVFSAAA